MITEGSVCGTITINMKLAVGQRMGFHDLVRQLTSHPDVVDSLGQ
jgi:hypothetical protein